MADHTTKRRAAPPWVPQPRLELHTRRSGRSRNAGAVRGMVGRGCSGPTRRLLDSIQHAGLQNLKRHDQTGAGVKASARHTEGSKDYVYAFFDPATLTASRNLEMPSALPAPRRAHLDCSEPPISHRHGRRPWSGQATCVRQLNSLCITRRFDWAHVQDADRLDVPACNVVGPAFHSSDKGFVLRGLRCRTHMRLLSTEHVHDHRDRRNCRQNPRA